MKVHLPIALVSSLFALRIENLNFALTSLLLHASNSRYKERQSLLSSSNPFGLILRHLGKILTYSDNREFSRHIKENHISINVKHSTNNLIGIFKSAIFNNLLLFPMFKISKLKKGRPYPSDKAKLSLSKILVKFYSYTIYNFMATFPSMNLAK